MAGPTTKTRWPYLQIFILALLFTWFVYYQAGPARVQFETIWGVKLSPVYRILAVIFDLALPLFAMGFGFAVVLLRRYDVKAWILLGLLLSFAEVLRVGNLLTASPPLMQSISRVYHWTGSELWPAWLFVFLIYFPARVQIDLRRPWLKWLIVAPFVVNAIFLISGYMGVAAAIRADPPKGFIDTTVSDGFVACFLALLSARYFVAESADQRRRLRLFYWGTLLTLAPALSLEVIRDYLHKANYDVFSKWLLLLVFGLLALFPAVLAYVIVVQRAMDVRVVVRQGIRYALARRGVNVLRALIISGFIYVIVMLTERHSGVWPQVLAIAIGILVINGIRSMADKARKWIDKRFFREQLRTEELLGDLANDVHRIIHTDELVRTVAQRIAVSLHVDRIAVWLTHGAGMVPAYSTNADGWNVGPMLGELREMKKPLFIHDENVGIGAELALPLMARDEMLGTMVLGTKRSEEPYSRTELDVLETVGSQTGLALDNSRLATSLAREAAQRERLNHEIEIAREVQQTLLPHEAGPTIPGIQYAGVCRPALGVGGDYYDFLPLPDGRFGFAIGDVSGKGVAAALLMASLQASLRGQTLDAPDDLASVVSRMNRLLFEATAPHRYATFFYAQYNPANRELTWVNAGHNPPLLFHGGETRKLEEGGPVIGLLPVAEYIQASAELTAGDLVIAYTDGISEAMNRNDVEWGEERFQAAIVQCTDGLPLPALLNQLLECADAHAAGAPQHDDMTLVGVRAMPLA